MRHDAWERVGTAPWYGAAQNGARRDQRLKKAERGNYGATLWQIAIL